MSSNYFSRPFNMADTIKAGIDNDDERDDRGYQMLRPADSMMSTDEETEAPEYSFDGFTMEFNEKVVLTPLSEKKTKP